LRRLNGGGDINAKEREEAERNFLRRFHDYEVKPARFYLFFFIAQFTDPLNINCVLFYD
jgi:hypothetical protein